jgi:2-phosphoglycerate kinase
VATIIDGKKRIPFMRGMLVHYLIERGFSYEEAYEVADAIRKALPKRKGIEKKEILKLIDQAIRAEHGERQVGDLIFWERLPTSITVEGKNETGPFSKERLAHSVQVAGLSLDQSYELAGHLESMLLGQRAQRISSQVLQELAEVMLAEQYDQGYAERYRVWRAWRELDQPLIVLIGGASGVGKTSLAISMANVLDIPRVAATDDIRQIMRLMLSPELMPSIHTSSYLAWASLPLTAGGADPVLTGFREQVKVVSLGVRAILDRCLEEHSSVIIDGVHLLPDFLEQWKNDHPRSFVAQLCLAVSERRVFEERFDKRAHEAPARTRDKYLVHLDEIQKIQEHIMEVSSQRDIPIIDTSAVSTVEETTKLALMVVVEQLQDREEIKRALDGEERKKRKKG